MTVNMEIVGCSKFPYVLHRMLEDASDNEELARVVSWLPEPITIDDHDGSMISNGFLMHEANISQCYCFKVHDNKEFCETVMPRYFSHQSRYKSFLRQLNMYGITRITKAGPNQGAYYHPLLVPGKAYLLDKISRANKRAAKSSNPKEPGAILPNLPGVQCTYTGLAVPNNQASSACLLDSWFDGDMSIKINSNEKQDSTTHHDTPQAKFPNKPFMLNAQQPILATPRTNSPSILEKKLSPLPIFNRSIDMTSLLASSRQSKTVDFGDSISWHHAKNTLQAAPREESIPSFMSHENALAANTASAITKEEDVAAGVKSEHLFPQGKGTANHQGESRATLSPLLSQNLASFYSNDVADDIIALFRSSANSMATMITNSNSPPTTTSDSAELSTTWEV